MGFSLIKSMLRTMSRLSELFPKSPLALVLLWAMLAVSTLAGPSPGFAQGKQSGRGTASGLPLPRYVSLKSDRVNIRGGPGIDYRILWVFRRAGLPVEVIKEYQGWRQIRDAEGGAGWVLGALLSGRRTALVLPWEQAGKTNAQTKLHQADSAKSRVLAFIQPGVLANIVSCTGTWCEVSIGDMRGFIEQKKLWGVYPGERLK